MCQNQTMELFFKLVNNSNIDDSKLKEIKDEFYKYNNFASSTEEEKVKLLEERCNFFNQEQGELEGYDCKKCKNRGYISKVFRNEIVDAECECMITRRNLQRLKNSGLTDLMLRCDFDTYKTIDKWQEIIKNKAMEYMQQDKRWFFIGGQVGCGKTHICTAIVNELLKIGKPSKYIIWRDELISLRANIMKDEEYSKIINPLKTIEVLYIDDFFKTEKGKTPTTSEINIAFEIINYRYNNSKLITIISSEKLLSEIINIDEAVGSRIKERTKEFSLNIGSDINKNYRLRD